jgi:hypothetical protein
MKKLALVLVLVMGIGVMSVGMVQADVINVGNPQWYAILFGPANPPTDAVGAFYANSAYPGDPPWTYSAATPTAVKITDAFTVGDIFNLYDNGLFVGTTSIVANNGAYYSPDPDVNFTTAELSHGLFILPAGNHSLTIQTYQNATGNTSGVAFFRVDAAPVPLPPSAWLLGSSLLGLVGWRRFKKG